MRFATIGALTASIAYLAFAVFVVCDVYVLTHPPRVRTEMTSSDLARAESVEFRTVDGLVLRGSIVPPRNGATIVLCHGHGVDRAQMLPEARLLVRAGFGVLLFDWRAHGESEGAISTRGDRERLDLVAAIDFLVGRSDVDPKRLGVLGFSRGASVAIEVAAIDPRVRGLVAQAGTGSLGEALAQDVRGPRVIARWPALWAARAAGIDVYGFQPERAISRIGPRPVFIMHGAQDRATPVSEAHRLYAAASQPKSLWIIDSAGHGGYIESEPIEYEQRLVAFFVSVLTSDELRSDKSSLQPAIPLQTPASHPSTH